MCKTHLIITQTDNCNFSPLIINYPYCPFMGINGEFLFSLSSETLFMSSFAAPNYILWGAHLGPCFEKWLLLLPSSLGSPLAKGPASSLVPRWQMSQASLVTDATSLQGGALFPSPGRTSLPLLLPVQHSSKKGRFRNPILCVQITALLLPCCVTLSPFLNLSASQF